ncbi:MAG TPA: glycoside hydrolase family 15 protein [Acidimicrobiales bacterium]|nr:glycoside hydrolase family 15 protein [Acidimicrobiales bacterium]
MRQSAISDYAFLSDCQGSALVSRAGDIDWWCTPRFDSPSVFGRLLDRGAGHWSLTPVEPLDVRRRYVPGSMVLETTFRTRTGTAQVRDALALGRGSRSHTIGREVPHALVRSVVGLSGVVDVCTEIAPGFHYGHARADAVETRAGVRFSARSTTVELRSDAPLSVDQGRARGEFRVHAGQYVTFSLGEPNHDHVAPRKSIIDDTVEGWQSWAQLHQRYDGYAAESVHRSALVLHALTYQPAGSVVAAPTTSLPEIPRGHANWDYRYAWLRDASLVLQALWVGACLDEADRYFAWLADVTSGDGGRVQVVYRVTGESELSERTLPHLAGYEGSRPVRVGKDAAAQTQLDVPGEALDSAWRLREQLDLRDDRTRSLLVHMAEHAATHWTKPDSGIWEGRDGQRHYLTSKLMCWVALDRAVRFGADLAGARDRDRWRNARDDIRRCILRDGWNGEIGAYAGAFGSTHLDAGVLLMPLVGFVEAGDPRMRSTIAAIDRHLATDGLVRRCSGADDEGAFVMCSYWLAQCFALAGEARRATELFARVTGHANDLGLLAEEIDPNTGRLLGNFPQALSHATLISAAWTIDQMLRATGAPAKAYSAAP